MSSKADARKARRAPRWNWNQEYWNFVRRLQIVSRPDDAPPRRHVRKYGGSWLLLGAIALNALLAGCAAGALTCDQVTLRRGQSCDVRPVYPRYNPSGTLIPKGMQ